MSTKSEAVDCNEGNFLNLNCPMMVGDCQKCRPELHDFVYNINHAVYLQFLPGGHTISAVCSPLRDAATLFGVEQRCENV